MDMFSKRVVAIPIWEAAPSEVTAEQFYRAWVCQRGTPAVIVSDRDIRFDIAFWRKLWALHHTSLKFRCLPPTALKRMVRPSGPIGSCRRSSDATYKLIS